VILCSTFEAPTVVSGFEDIAVVGQAIEQCGGHLGRRCERRANKRRKIKGYSTRAGKPELRATAWWSWRTRNSKQVIIGTSLLTVQPLDEAARR
jgi:hypothetical protein